MEILMNQMDIDMRKLKLYSEMAMESFRFAITEAELYSESDEEFAERIITEAEKAEKAQGNFFSRLLEKVTAFFQNIQEKTREVFTKKKIESINNAIKEDPSLKQVKLEIPDAVTIKKACDHDWALCNQLIKKAQAGKLTQEEFDAAVSKSIIKQNKKNKKIQKAEERAQRLSKAKKITVTVASALAIVGGGAAIAKYIHDNQTKITEAIQKLKETSQRTFKNVKRVGKGIGKAVNTANRVIEKGADILDRSGPDHNLINNVATFAADTMQQYTAEASKATAETVSNIKQAVGGVVEKVTDTVNKNIQNTHTSKKFPGADINGVHYSSAIDVVKLLKSKGQTEALNKFVKKYGSYIEAEKASRHK